MTFWLGQDTETGGMHAPTGRAGTEAGHQRRWEPFKGANPEESPWECEMQVAHWGCLGPTMMRAACSGEEFKEGECSGPGWGDQVGTGYPSLYALREGNVGTLGLMAPKA